MFPNENPFPTGANQPPDSNVPKPEEKEPVSAAEKAAMERAEAIAKLAKAKDSKLVIPKGLENKPFAEMTAAEKQSIAQANAVPAVRGSDVGSEDPVKRKGAKQVKINPNADDNFNAVQASRMKQFQKRNAMRGDFNAQLAAHMANFKPTVPPPEGESK